MRITMIAAARSTSHLAIPSRPPCRRSEMVLWNRMTVPCARTTDDLPGLAWAGPAMASMLRLTGPLTVRMRLMPAKDRGVATPRRRWRRPFVLSCRNQTTGSPALAQARPAAAMRLSALLWAIRDHPAGLALWRANRAMMPPPRSFRPPFSSFPKYSHGISRGAAEPHRADACRPDKTRFQKMPIPAIALIRLAPEQD